MTVRSPLLRIIACISVCLAIFFGFYACSKAIARDQDIVQPAPNPVQHKIDSLLALMTLYEKVGQLVQYSAYAEMTGPGQKDPYTQNKYDRIRSGGVGSLINVVDTRAAREAQELAVGQSRLGIPLLFGYDVIHGFKTMFPVPLGETASWDMEAIERSARIAAIEAASAGIQWTFAPMIDICRDGRWGRIMEGAGEDPWLTAQAGVARVRGFQGTDLSDPLTIAACPKHFAAYGFAEAGRDYNTVDISEHTLRNVILPPFKACVDAGAATVMTSFNEIGGVPSTGNREMVRGILKTEWGFDGMVVSDWGSVAEMIPHGYAADRQEATTLALEAGVDVDMEGNCYEAFLEELVRNGTIDIEMLDDAVRRMLTLKYELGLMDDPYRYINTDREQEQIYSDQHRSAARDIARKSIVLLKNEEAILPLSVDGAAIAVIGPFAKDKDTPLGNWRGQAITNSAVSLYEGIAAAAGSREVLYAEGCRLSVGPRNFASELILNQTDTSGFAEACAVAARAGIVILALGEDSQQTGEGRSQAGIGLSGVQQQLLERVAAVNPNIVVVLMNGRPLVLKWMSEHVPGIVEAWHLGSEAGHAIADVLFGTYNPSGRLPVSFPRSVGQLPLYYAQKNTGRPGPLSEVFWSHYTDEENTPLYPFGYGLSYTTFTYGEMELNHTSMTPDDRIAVSIEVINTGDRTGKEVVQLYIRDLVASVTRPVRELRDFRMIELAPGARQIVHFELNADALKFYTRDGTRICEDGRFEVFVGPNVRDTQSREFTLAGADTQ